MSDVDLSWMNVPGPDGLTFIQRYERGLLDNQTAADLSWMNVRGPDGLTFIEKFNQGKLPSQTSAPPKKELTVDQNNAYAELKRNLANFKLDSLVDPLWNYMIETGVTNDDQLWLWIQERPEFAARFPAFKQLQEKGRAISPAAYMELEKSYESIMRAANIPSYFFDRPDDFTDLIIGNVSPAEFQTRVEKGYKRVAESDPLVREAFKTYFGIEGDSALAAFFIDPERSAPALERAVQSAEIQAAALRANNSVDLSYASKLVSMGVSYEQALQGFQRLNALKGLFAAGVGETEIVSPPSVQNDLISDLRKPVEMQPTVLPPDWQEGDPLPGGEKTSEPRIQDSSSMTSETQAGVNYIFGTDVEVQRELELRLKQRKAQASGVTQQNVSNRQGRTGVGTAD